MNWGKKNKLIAFAVAGLFVVTGTYNAVVINSESHISGEDVKFVKRLDEIYGITVHGREVAASVQWQKIAPSIAAKKFSRPVSQKVSFTASASAAPSASEVAQVAAVQEQLNMSLVEVVNPNKYKNGVAAGSFSGSLATNNGTIESLSVSLPNGEGLSVSFSEMTGNVFEYDLNGELFSGMMYQVDQSAYMVTLTNGPLEGTRLRFSTQSAEVQAEQVQTALAENNNIEVGSFGSEPQGEEITLASGAEISPEQMIQNDQQMQQEAAQAQGFNFEAQTM